MRRVRPLLAAVALTAAMTAALTGCATTVDGSGTPDVEATGTTTATTTPSDDEGGSEGGSDGGGDPSALACDGDQAVAPVGQPFCFTLPDGFTQQEIEVDNSAGNAAAYTTGVALSQRDVIVFSVYPLALDSDDLTDGQIADALEPIIVQLAAGGFTFDSTEPEVRMVDEARAFFYQGSDATGLFSDTYFIFRGETELQINCQWADAQEALLASCDEVLDSLDVTG